MTNSTPEDPCNPNLSDVTRAVYAFLLIAVAATGTVGNSILSYYVIKNTQMQSLINVLLATMAICDTLISCLCAPFDVFTTLSGYWLFGEYMCAAHSYVLSVLVVQNVTMFIIISVDRYFILVHKKDKFRACRAKILLSSCMIFSLIVSSPPLYHRGKFIFSNEHCRKLCNDSEDSHIYSLLYASFLYVLPTGLLLLAYIHITVSIRKMKRKVLPIFDHTLSVRKGKCLRVSVMFKQKTFPTLICLYVAAVACKFPLATSIFLQSIKTDLVCPISHWIILLTYVNSAINPLIYALKIDQYWMMLTGKFYRVKNQVKSFRRKSKSSSKPQTIYTIAKSRGSVI